MVSQTVIYKQQYAGQCWSYATLNCLQRLWVKVTEQEVLSWWSMLWFPDIDRTLRKYKKWQLGYLKNKNLVESFLRRGIPLMALIYRNNFNSTRYAPYLQDFRGKMNHFVCLVEDCGNKFKVVDQQGENFGDKGYWYIDKKDFSKIKVARCLNVSPALSIPEPTNE